MAVTWDSFCGKNGSPGLECRVVQEVHGCPFTDKQLQYVHMHASETRMHQRKRRTHVGGEKERTGEYDGGTVRKVEMQVGVGK